MLLEAVGEDRWARGKRMIGEEKGEGGGRKEDVGCLRARGSA